jgi:hypothetical protein
MSQENSMWGAPRIHGELPRGASTFPIFETIQSDHAPVSGGTPHSARGIAQKNACLRVDAGLRSAALRAEEA